MPPTNYSTKTTKICVACGKGLGAYDAPMVIQKLGKGQYNSIPCVGTLMRPAKPYERKVMHAACAEKILFGKGKPKNKSSKRDLSSEE